MEDIIAKLKTLIKQSEILEEDEYYCSWGEQIGVLISTKEARNIVKLLEIETDVKCIHIGTISSNGKWDREHLLEVLFAKLATDFALVGFEPIAPEIDFTQLNKLREEVIMFERCKGEDPVEIDIKLSHRLANNSYITGKKQPRSWRKK